MQYKKKRDNKKPLAVALGVILALAPGAVIVDNLEPVPVYADAGELAGLTDYLNAGMALDESGAPSVVWGINGYAAYASGLWAIRECLRHPITGNEFTVASLSSISGKFIYNGVLYPCISIAVASGNYAYDEGAFILFESPPFNITFQVYPADQSTEYTYYISGGINNQLLTITTSRYLGDSIASFRGTLDLRGGNAFDQYLRTVNSGSRYAYNFYIQYGSGIPEVNPALGLSYYLGNGVSTDRHAIAGEGVRSTFPGGADTPVTLDYIQNVYNPWYIETYPELEPYIYAPYSPEFPDPSDAYPGIPKDWTIKNPQLPTSPSIGLNAYKPDLSEMNPSESIMEYDSGFDFWWWLTNQALTHTNTKTIVLLAILLGLVGYLLWHLGGHL